MGKLCVMKILHNLMRSCWLFKDYTFKKKCIKCLVSYNISVSKNRIMLTVIVL